MMMNEMVEAESYNYHVQEVYKGVYGLKTASDSSSFSCSCCVDAEFEEVEKFLMTSI